MKFLGDMGVSQTTINWLREMGHDAIHLREQHLQKISDREIIEKARLEDRIILTFDLDFTDLLVFSKGSNPSTIIFRLHDATPRNVNNRLNQVLNESHDALIKGVIISVEETRHRVREFPVH